MKKRLFTILLSLMMVLCILPKVDAADTLDTNAAEGASQNNQAATLDLSLGSITLSETAGEHYYQLGNAAAIKYNGTITITQSNPTESTANFIKVESGSHEITLNHVNISSSGPSVNILDTKPQVLTLDHVTLHSTGVEGIRSNGDISLILYGSSTVSASNELNNLPDESDMSCGIQAYAALNICGTGDLTVTGGDAPDSFGVCADTLSVTGSAKLTGKGGTASSYSTGIAVFPLVSGAQDLFVSDQASLVGIGGNIVLPDPALGWNYGTSHGILADGTTVQTGGSIYAKSGNGHASLDPDDANISASIGFQTTALSIDAGTLTGIGGDWTGEGIQSYGIQIFALNQTGGTIRAEGGNGVTDQSKSVFYIGLFSIDTTMGDLADSTNYKMSGGLLSVKGDWGVFGFLPSMTGGAIEISGNSALMYTKIDSQNTLLTSYSVPAGMTAKTSLNADGSEATAYLSDEAFPEGIKYFSLTQADAMDSQPNNPPSDDVDSVDDVSPETGDSAYTPWIFLMIFAGILTASLLIKKQRISIHA